MGMVVEAIDSFVKAEDASEYVEVINVASKSSKFALSLRSFTSVNIIRSMMQ